MGGPAFRVLCEGRWTGGPEDRVNFTPEGARPSFAWAGMFLNRAHPQNERPTNSRCHPERSEGSMQSAGQHHKRTM